MNVHHAPSTPIFCAAGGGPTLGDVNINGDSVLLPGNPGTDGPSPMPIDGTLGPPGGMPVPGPLLPLGIVSAGGMPGPLVNIPDGGIPGPDGGPDSTPGTEPDSTPGIPGPVGGKTPGPANWGE